jgi:hypothetical protein
MFWSYGLKMVENLSVSLRVSSSGWKGCKCVSKLYVVLVRAKDGGIYVSKLDILVVWADDGEERFSWTLVLAD